MFINSESTYTEEKMSDVYDEYMDDSKTNLQKFIDGEIPRDEFNAETCSNGLSSVKPTFYQKLDFDKDCNSIIEIILDNDYYPIHALYVWIAIIVVILFLILRTPIWGSQHDDDDGNNPNPNGPNRSTFSVLQSQIYGHPTNGDNTSCYTYFCCFCCGFSCLFMLLFIILPVVINFVK